MNTGTKKKAIISVTVIGATALLIVGAVIVKGQVKTETSTATTSTTTPATKSTNDSSTTSSNNYKDGTYSADGSYSSPDGTQKIGLTITIADGTVTATSADNKANGLDSAQYEDQFISSYKNQIVGKKVSSLKGTVSGDSLTLIGFEDALAQIQNQAKV
ncbi:MAG: calcium-binding protein [Candidatus Saccharibacteria bacterium]|nr:calcium-binding protein [Candidatus Saccharibacteria bacterium]